MAQEAKFIRHEENRIKKKQKIIPYDYVHTLDRKSSDFWRLREHRKSVVRPAVRAAQLAYAFLRGVPYRKVEPSTKPPVGHYPLKQWELLVKEVKRFCNKFSDGGKVNYDAEIDEWFKIKLDTE